ncbi:hypothetical protein D9756_010327 [Leucocoprinus leucothites]|uniref:F-box domain-containing protein n=1 Tax=Leucocoprinus leucothites TaxID=201217 RepID=A0A8H5FT18_9AGAR|nr:hypothetical protein D9756_010327 [Leucoagaricus leucothites]
MQQQRHDLPSLQHKPLPTIPGARPSLATLKMTGGGAIENIPRQRTASSTTASELIRRVSNIFSSRRGGSITRRSGSTKRRPPALNLPHRGVSRVYESSLYSLSDEDEEDDDIRRPSGLGSAVSISSLPPSPFSPSHNNVAGAGNTGDDNEGDNKQGSGKGVPSHMPFGYIRARATSTPNLLRSLSLRSRGSKRSKKGRPRNNSGISSRDGTTTEDSHSHRAHFHLPLRSSTSLLPQSRSSADDKSHGGAGPMTVLSIPAETIALVFTYLDSKSSIAQIAHTCHLFLSASRMVLYTHINLDEFQSESQLERFVALLASRRDFTDLVRTFSCTSWPRFFLPTKPQLPPPSTTSLSATTSPVAHSPPQSRSSYTGPSSSIHPIQLFLDHDQDQDPATQHRNTLLTATFTLAFQRMSNLISLTLPSYDHDLLAYHTAFGLRNITFLCSTILREEGKALFGWLDGQINIVRLEFPNLLVIDGELDFGSSGDEPGEGKTSIGIVGKGKGVRPVTSSGSGLLRQISASAAIGSGSPGAGGETKTGKGDGGGGKKYMVAPYLVPLNSASSPKPPNLTINRSQSPVARPRPRDHLKLSPRPKSAAPDSPSYATFSEALSKTTTPTISENPSPLSTPSPITPSHVPFPTSRDSDPSSPRPLTVAITSSANPLASSSTSPSSPLSSPTLLPNLTTLHGPPSLIIALSSPPSSSLSPITSGSSGGNTRRPLHSISLNITNTLYSGLRPATIMARLVGTTRVLTLRFGESVDRRSVEKVLGAAGSSLGGVRERSLVSDEDSSADEKGNERKVKGEMNGGFTFGRGEWKGLVELNIGFVAGGPGSDEVLHKMISSTVLRYPYLRVLTLKYLPPGSLTSPSSSHTSTSPVLNIINANELSPSHSSMLPTPPQSISPLPTTPTSFTSSTISAPPSLIGSVITPTTPFTPTLTTAGGAVPMVKSVPPRNESLRKKPVKMEKALSPPERAYVRQWTKHCVDLERVVFLSGGEWVRGRK